MLNRLIGNGCGSIPLLSANIIPTKKAIFMNTIPKEPIDSEIEELYLASNLTDEQAKLVYSLYYHWFRKELKTE